MEKQLLLVLNPCAGQRRANRLMPEILRVFWDAGYRCVSYVTSCQGDAQRYVEAHAAEFDRIVCIGGDGTLNETIAGVLRAGANPSIGYIPAGTTNDYANSLGLASDVLEAAAEAAEGEVYSLDVGWFNGRHFIYTASCGAFTKASYSTPQSMKNALGHLAYVLEGIKDISSLRPWHMRVETENSVIEDDFIFAAIANSTSIGGILRLESNMVALDDGRFEVMLVRNPVTVIQLSSILHGITTLELPNEMVHFFSAERINIACDRPLEWTLDGERAEGGDSVEIRNLHEAVRMVLPTVHDGDEPEEDEE